MIFLLFECVARDAEITLNDEFSEYILANENDLESLDLNVETVDTLKKLGKLQ